MCSTPNSNSYPYSSKTLINNWNEDQFLLQSLTASYVEKLRTSKSLLEHTKSVVEHFYEDVQLEAPCTYISYGATIQLCAIDFRPSGAAAAAEPLMLSLYLDANHMRRTPYHLTQHCDVSVAPGERPCRRNTFVVRSADARERLGEPLRYGDAFNLQLTEPDANGAPLVLYSAPQTVSRLDGSCPSMSLGVCQRHERSDEHRLGLSVTPPLHCNWKALYIQPNLRYEMEGEPVPVSTPQDVCRLGRWFVHFGSHIWR